MVLVIGSKNSSNSPRLVETAEANGSPGLPDRRRPRIGPGVVRGKDAVLVTAGASAPDHLVNGLLDRLKHDLAATVGNAHAGGRRRILLSPEIAQEPAVIA